MDGKNKALSRLHTEQRNEDTVTIAGGDTLHILSMINNQDRGVATAVAQALPQIAEAVELIAARLADGGRLVYVGAGTSGRLGIMDAAECAPTYAVNNVCCVMAGGKDAVFCAQELLEDSEQEAERDLAAFGLRDSDTVFALAASGRTPYCIGALDYAQKIGAAAVSLSCNPNARMSKHAMVAIEVDSGPESVMGSTRMKAGTAQKMVLNMVSTAVMIKLGRTYGNLMIKLNSKNAKCSDRAARIFLEATGTVDQQYARLAIEQAGGSLEVAVLHELTGKTAEQAKDALAACGGHFERALAAL